MKTLFCVFLLLFSCKAKDEAKPVYFTAEGDDTNQSRRQKCEMNKETDHKIWISSEEICVDEAYQEIEACNKGRITRWNPETRLCETDPDRVAILRNNECKQKGGVIVNGVCSSAK